MLRKGTSSEGDCQPSRRGRTFSSDDCAPPAPVGTKSILKSPSDTAASAELASVRQQPTSRSAGRRWRQHSVDNPAVGPAQNPHGQAVRAVKFFLDESEGSEPTSLGQPDHRQHRCPCPAAGSAAGLLPNSPFRRTSLPVQSNFIARQNSLLHNQVNSARGLLMDLLASSNRRELSPNVSACLRAVTALLNTGQQQNSGGGGGPPGPNSALSLSDLGIPRVVESPYGGELIALTSKPRVSNITFSTVTSATGLPTIAAEPSRPRSSSYWKPAHSHICAAGGSTGPSPSSLSSHHHGHGGRQQQLLLAAAAEDEVPGEELAVLSSQQEQQPERTAEGEEARAEEEGAENEGSKPRSRGDSVPLSDDATIEPGIGGRRKSSRIATAVTAGQPRDDLARPPQKWPTVAPAQQQKQSESGKDRAADEASCSSSSEQSSSSSSSGVNSLEGENRPTAYKAVDGTEFDRAELERDQTLRQIQEWSFPIFQYADRHRRTVLTRLSYAIFNEANLFRTFKISPAKFFNYFHALEAGYWDIPYHNRIHAADVLHGCFYLTCHPVNAFCGFQPDELLDEEEEQETEQMEGEGEENHCGHGVHQQQSFAVPDSGRTALPLAQSMSALELMALFTAAAMHDYDHPGRTNAFLVASEDRKAILYNDRSVLENHHAAESWRLLTGQSQNHFIENLDSAETKRFRYLVLEYILATDLKQHFDIIMQFNERAAEMDLANEADRVLVSLMLIKFADINSPAKPYNLHRQWTERICQEFYEQGDEEKDRHMAISPYMDRNEPAVAKLQDSFIAHIVNPLAMALNEAGLLPVLPGLPESELVINLKHNHSKWLQQIETEQRTEEGGGAHEPSASSCEPGRRQLALEEEGDQRQPSARDSAAPMNNGVKSNPAIGPEGSSAPPTNSASTKSAAVRKGSGKGRNRESAGCKAQQQSADNPSQQQRPPAECNNNNNICSLGRGADGKNNAGPAAAEVTTVAGPPTAPSPKTVKTG